jgi:putrescine transport system permease protein
VTPDINALATITVTIVGIGVLIAGIVMNRAERRRNLDAQMAYRANG